MKAVYSNSVTFNSEFTWIRSEDKFFDTDNVRLSAELIPAPNCIESVQFHTAVQNLRFWIETVVNNSMVISATDPWSCFLMLDGIQSTAFLLPSKSIHDILSVFKRKINAIGNDYFLCGAISLYSQCDSVTYHFDDEDVPVLPSIADWVKDENYYYKLPWWDRPDASTRDILPEYQKETDLTVSQPWAYSLDVMMPDNNDNIIKFPGKPSIKVVVDNDKDEDQ